MGPSELKGWDRLTAKQRRLVDDNWATVQWAWELQDTVRKAAGRAVGRKVRVLPINARAALRVAVMADEYSREDIQVVLEAYGLEMSRALQGGEKNWFDGVSNWRPENFDRRLGAEDSPRIEGRGLMAWVENG